MSTISSNHPFQKKEQIEFRNARALLRQSHPKTQQAVEESLNSIKEIFSIETQQSFNSEIQDFMQASRRKLEYRLKSENAKIIQELPPSQNKGSHEDSAPPISLAPPVSKKSNETDLSDKADKPVRKDWGAYWLSEQKYTGEKTITPELKLFFEKHKEDPVVQFIAESLDRGGTEYTKWIQEFPFVASLDEKALLSTADWYKQKYNIDIHIVSGNDIQDKLSEIQKTVVNPTFVGLVVGTPGLFGTHITLGHVAPAIVFFQPDQPPQLLIMDVVGATFGVSQNRMIKEALDKSTCKICCYTGPTRQADYLSCRTGAMVLLRNALLSLKDRGDDSQKLWSKVWHEGEIVSLPPEWTYGEQIQFSTENERKNALAIRDKFSSKELKRKNPLTIQEEKEKKSEVVTFWYSFELSAEESARFKEYKKTSDDIEINCSQGYVILKVKKKISTALIKKGLKGFIHNIKKEISDLIVTGEISPITSPESLAKDLLHEPISPQREKLIQALGPRITGFRIEPTFPELFARELNKTAPFLFPR